MGLLANLHCWEIFWMKYFNYLIALSHSLPFASQINLNTWQNMRKIKIHFCSNTIIC
jgi:hypothetical protein